MKEIRIPPSRNKLYLLLAGSLVFAGIGIWSVTDPAKFNNSKSGNPASALIIGIIAIVLFGLAAVMTLIKLSGDKPGLVINSKGILDNFSGISTGFILWKAIVEIRTVSVRNQKFLLIVVKNPEVYIHQQKSRVKRKALEMNYRTYGSPISIHADTLAMNFEELHDLVQNALIHNKTILNRNA